MCDYVSTTSLAKLAQTSKSMCGYIRKLLVDSQLIIQPISKLIKRNCHSEISVHFGCIGSLLRSTTTFLDTKDKLIALESFIFELEESYIEISQKLSVQFAYDCIGLLINRFIKEWDDDALRAVFLVISRLSHLEERLNRVILVDKPGILRKFEKDIRIFLRLVFIEKVVSPDQHSLWLSLLMRMFPTQQARLLYLIYGPTEEVESRNSDEVDWYLLTQCTDYGNLLCPYEALKDLANVFLIVSNSTRFQWSETTTIRFFHEITCNSNFLCI